MLNPRDVVVGIPDRNQLYFMRNKSFVQTTVPDMIDLCSNDGTLFIVGQDGRIYNEHSKVVFQVPIPLKWCAVRRYDGTIYVGSDYGVYKVPGAWRQPWLMKPGTEFVDWHDDEFVSRNTSFRYSLDNDRIIVFLSESGFLVHKSVNDARLISHQWIEKNARGIAWV